MVDAKSFLGNAAGSRLFFSERDSDISIRVEWEGQRWHFPGHKLVLSTMSDVFRTMLDSDMLERSSRVVTIRDFCPYAVKQMLKYIYIGIVDFTGWHDTSNLLRIAHKYAVHPLVALCETYLVTQIVFGNACELLELSRVYALQALRKEATSFILDAGFIVAFTEGFCNLRPKALEGVLSSGGFNMESEGCVLSCLREWAVSECSRRCVPLSRPNVLLAMEPFLKYIRWDYIPESSRTFIPSHLYEKHKDDESPTRKPFHVPPSLQYHMSTIKFVLELGVFNDYTVGSEGLGCLKFSVDNHIFITGFRMVGLFGNRSASFVGPSCLTLSREDNKFYIQFNLNSLPWRKGSAVGRDVWQEMVAYLPFPIRVDPFSSYVMTIKSRRSKEIENAKWPRTRIDSEIIVTESGTVNFKCYGQTHGITQLLMLPAPFYRNACDNSD